jgi:hypothetical protein
MKPAHICQVTSRMKTPRMTAAITPRAGDQPFDTFELHIASSLARRQRVRLFRTEQH